MEPQLVRCTYLYSFGNLGKLHGIYWHVRFACSCSHQTFHFRHQFKAREKNRNKVHSF